MELILFIQQNEYRSKREEKKSVQQMKNFELNLKTANFISHMISGGTLYTFFSVTAIDDFNGKWEKMLWSLMLKAEFKITFKLPGSLWPSKSKYHSFSVQLFINLKKL